MTNVKMLESVYRMVDEAIRLALPETDKIEETLRKGLLSINSEFGSTIDILKSHIANEDAKRNGRSKQLTVAKRIIKNAKKFCSSETLHGAWIGKNGYQFVSDSYRVIMFENHLQLPEAEGSERIESIVSKTYPNYDKKLMPPSVPDLKAMLTEHKAKHKGERKIPALSYVFEDFEIGVNAQYLLDMLEAMPDGKFYMTGGVISPIYIESDGIKGLLLPIRLKQNEKNI